MDSSSRSVCLELHDVLPLNFGQLQAPPGGCRALRETLGTTKRETEATRGVLHMCSCLLRGLCWFASEFWGWVEGVDALHFQTMCM